jgi:anti-sigma B factor antagonist
MAQPDTDERHTGSSGRDTPAADIGPSANPLPRDAASGPAPARLALTISHDSQNCFIDLAGELDLSTLDVLDDAVAGMCSSGYAATVIFGMRRVSFIDCAGLGRLVRLHEHLHSTGGRVLLFRPSPRVRRLLELTRLTTTLEIR